LEAYSARGNLVRLSGDVFVQVQKSRIFRRSGKKSRIHSLNSAKFDLRIVEVNNGK
jgi:hypothetical protein